MIINYPNNQITYAPGPNGARDTWAHESGSLIEMIKLKPPAKADITRVVKHREHKDARSAQHSEAVVRTPTPDLRSAPDVSVPMARQLRPTN